MKYTKDGCTTKVQVLEDGSISISAKSGYSQGVNDICSITDNGNGYYVKTKSYSCTEPDHIFNLDYSEIEYIYMAYKALKKEGKV